MKFDFENMKNYIRNYVENNKEKLGIDENDAEILKSFDSSLFNIQNKTKQKILIEIINDKIIPEIAKMKYNKYTNVIKRKIEDLENKIENINYEPVSSNSEIERLNDLITKEETTNLIYNYDKLYKEITGEKPMKTGSTMKKSPVNFEQGKIKVEILNDDKVVKNDVK